MKRICLFPGQSERNEAWLHLLGEHLSERGWEVICHHYAHWKEGGDFDREREVSRFRERFPEGVVVDAVIAKSAGISVSLELLERGVLTTARYVGCGFPIGVMGPERVPAAKERLARLSTRVNVSLVQETSDKVGSFASVAEAFKDVPNITLREVPGHDHLYGDVEVLVDLASAILPK